MKCHHQTKSISSYLSAAVVLTVVFYGALYMAKDDQSRLMFTAYTFSLAELAAVFFLGIWLNHRHLVVEKKFGMMILASIVVYSGESIAYYVYTGLLKTSLPFISAAELFPLASNTLLIFTLLYLVGKYRQNIFNLRMIFDLLITLLAIFVMSWAYVIYPLIMARKESLFTFLLSGWYPLTDIGFLIAAMLLFVVREKLPVRIRWIITGIVLMIGADVLNMVILNLSQEIGVYWMMPIWVLPIFLMMLAVQDAAKWPVNIERTDDSVSAVENVLQVIPYYTLVPMIAVMLLEHGHIDPVIVGTAIFSLLVILKQYYSTRDNAQMTRQIYDACHQLQENNRELIANRDKLAAWHQEKKNEARSDALTACYNRRYINEMVAHLAEQENKLKYLAVLLIDIDEFKNINDRYGHTFGDLVLQQVAAIIKELIRPTEMVGRYGGDEFIVILPEVDIEEALIIAERIRIKVQDHCFSDASFSIGCSVSIGAAEWTEQDRLRRDIVTKSDCALYAAKKNGRNRTVVFGSEMAGQD